jgi:hypothetical protein
VLLLDQPDHLPHLLHGRQAVPARPNPNGSNPTNSLLIQYAPIEYVTLPIGIFATAFTQFLVRCEHLH